MPDANLGLLIGLLVLAIPLVALARRFDVSYPIVLVASGVVLGFIPRLPPMHLDPNVVLLVFLPPLLYWEAITAPTDVMVENSGQIGVLAIGLVVITTVAVALVAHEIVPGMPWAVAFVLGAIVSPTDELAAVPVLERFRLPRHVIAIVDGESLLNDATALVIYATAITAVTTGAFAIGGALGHFVLNVVGSIAIGLIAGRIGVELWKHIKDQQLQGVISFVLPFLAYYPAQLFGLSGVLAVVTAGVYANRFTPRVMTAAARTQVIGFWDTLVFLANAGLFLVVGLQLHTIGRAAFAHNSWQLVVGSVVALNVVLIVVRIAGVLAAEYAPTAAPADHAAPDWRHALVVGWSGLRGAVSLAAALAIPLALPGGAPFPNRDLIIFVTFSVIVVTLIGGGLTLPWLVNVLHITGDNEERDELHEAIVRAADAALERIDELERDGTLDAAHARRLRTLYEHKRDVHSDPDDDAKEEHLAKHLDVEMELIDVQRNAVIAMRERGEIDNVVLRRIQADLDAGAIRRSRN
jgi:CPA1 family monovalent cation:H+ antiporter